MADVMEQFNEISKTAYEDAGLRAFLDTLDPKTHADVTLAMILLSASMSVSQTQKLMEVSAAYFALAITRLKAAGLNPDVRLGDLAKGNSLARVN